MKLFDGTAAAEKLRVALRAEVESIGRKIRLAIIAVGDDPATAAFIKKKAAFGKAIGCGVRAYEHPATISTAALRKRAAEIVRIKANTGVIIQLPLPKQIRADYILNAVTPDKDVDVLSSRLIGDYYMGRAPIAPPVVGALRLFLERERVLLAGKRILVVGAGRLVGKPAVLWLLNQKVPFTVYRQSYGNMGEFTKDANVIITGVGVPRLITGDMVKNGVVLFDAGTAKGYNGKLAGDVDIDSVSDKAAYLTPVPGGVGPVTVALLFQNLITLAKVKKR